MWQAYPCALERQYYDVRLNTGRVVRQLWPTNLHNFTRSTVFVLGTLVREVRISNQA